MKKITPEQLLNCKAHLGHRAPKVHPRSKKYLYKIEKGVSIIDLFKTVKKLEKGRKFLINLGKEKKILLVVATKKQVKNIIEDLCQTNKIFYIVNKWIGGFLTNFDEVLKNIRKLKQIKKDKEEGIWNNFPKHERIKLEKKLHKISSIYQGVEDLEKLPDAVYIVDIKKEQTALKETQRREIPTIAIVDTNCNPDLVTFPIPANDDDPESVRLISQYLLEAYDEGRKQSDKKI